MFNKLSFKMIVLMIATILLLTACETKTQVVEFDPLTVDYTKMPMAIIELESGETIKVSLFPDIAPNTVNNFIDLSQSGFYDGLIFHRVIPDFMIQGGDPEGTGMGGPGYSIKGEFATNGFENPLKHVRGVISMARARDKDTAGSQFFIVQKDYPSLDDQYAGFGYVVEGIEVVDQVSGVERDKNDLPIKPVIIKRIQIELNDYEPSEVQKLNLQ